MRGREDLKTFMLLAPAKHELYGELVRFYLLNLIA